MMGMRYISCFLIVGLLVCSLCASDQEQAEEPLQVGEDAPDFTLQNAEDQEHALKKMRGKVVFLIMGTEKSGRKMTNGGTPFSKIMGRTIGSSHTLSLICGVCRHSCLEALLKGSSRRINRR